MENTTDFELVPDDQNGVQEGVVDSQEDESRNSEEADDGRESFVDSQEDGNGEEGTEVGEDGEEDSLTDGAGRSGAKNQSREENSAIRAARLRAKREAEREAADAADRDIRESGILNPSTGKPFANMAELRAYNETSRRERLAARARAEGKSFEEVEEEDLNRRFISDMRRREEQKAQDPDEDFLKRDVLSFVEKYPEFNSADKLGELENNREFRRFCGSRFGREPLADLYSDFVETVSSAEKTASAKSESRLSRSTGGGNGGGATLTPSQRKTLDEWNAANPDMQMTPKEFLSR